MSIEKIYGIAGTALNAQLTRMNATASNLANAGTVASTPEEVFKPKRAVFKALVNDQMTHAGAPYLGGVKVDRMSEDSAPARGSATHATPWRIKMVMCIRPMSVKSPKWWK